MGDETPFDPQVFIDRPKLIGGGIGTPSPEFTTDSAMARHEASLQPKRDPNDIRESYGLPHLDDAGIEAWLAGTD